MTTQPDSVDFLLIGKTGHGKSATGNSILGRAAFKASSSLQSVTEGVSCESAESCGRTIKVVDTPGCVEWGMENAEIQTHMLNALAMCNGGVDAFVYVIRYGFRFTQEDLSALEALRKIFGSNYSKHLIVVVTGGDLFQQDMQEDGYDITFEDWCNQQKGCFRELLDKCKGRSVLLNNRERDEKKMLQQRKQLIHIVDALTEKEGKYVSQTFRAAQEVRERVIRELRTPVLRESTHQHINLLFAEIERMHTVPSDNARKQIQKLLQDLEDEMKTRNRGIDQTEDQRKLMNALEQNCSDVLKLMKLSQELENIRETKQMFGLLGTGITIVGGALGILVPFIGAVLGVTGAVSTVAGCLEIESKEKELLNNRNKIMEQRLQSKCLFSERKAQEFQGHTKDD